MTEENKAAIKGVVKMWLDLYDQGGIARESVEHQLAEYAIGLNNTLMERQEKVKETMQQWVDKQGHDRCWYYPELFQVLAREFGITPNRPPNLPSLEEFKIGCERYQAEEFK